MFLAPGGLPHCLYRGKHIYESLVVTWGYGATVARLTPDQKVGSSNLSALIGSVRVHPAAHRRM